MNEQSAPPELFQFVFSHFNEKARWGLDHKRIPHRRHSLLPGPHALRVTRLSGQTKVPVLRHDGQVVRGSGRILDHLEEHWPEPALFPKEPEPRERVHEIQTWFDERIGPAVRQAIFFEILPDHAYAARMFAHGQPALRKRLYALGFPLLARFLRRELRLYPEDAEGARERTREGLDFVAREAGATGHLAGNRFTAADLTAASLLFPAVFPEQLQFPVPQPLSPRMRTWLDRWEDHPGAEWVRNIYRRHRSPSAEILP